MPVSRNGWIIKFSSYRDNSILLFVVSQHTGQTIIRYFKDEDEACKFINLVIELNSQEEYDQSAGLVLRVAVAAESTQVL
jgi:hypothetical protein